MKLIGSVIVLLFLVKSSSSQDTTCVTTTGRSGSCVNVKNCAAIIRILKGPRPLSPETLEILRSSQCGFDGTAPRVCCDNEPATTVRPTAATEIRNDETSTAVSGPPDVTRHPNLRLLDDYLCGPITQGKIFGGNKTGVFDFPWMALIAYQVGGIRHEFRCGGSIINKRYVLTAAHCVTQLPSDLVLSGVRLGDHDISKERDCDMDEDGLEVVCAERYQDFGIDSFHYHPEYSSTKLQNDVAIIRLNSDADFRPASVRPICMPLGPAATIGQKKVTVTGWGATETGTRSQDLLRVLVAQVPNAQCAATYQKSTTIWYKQMCAGGKNRMDSCLGDSGGPLQSPGLYKNSVKYIQHGIVSFGTRQCGIEGFPGVYTRVAYYLDWILDTMRD